jgi:cytochrome c2
MVAKVLKGATERASRCAALIATLSCLLWFAGNVPASAQTAPTAEEARLLEFGKEIFKSKAVCQYCHKWDASGDQGYGGNALSLRATQSHARPAHRGGEMRPARHRYALP